MDCRGSIPGRSTAPRLALESLESTLPPIQWVLRALFAGLKRPGSLPSTVEDKNDGAHVLVAWCLIKHRNFTLPSLCCVHSRNFSVSNPSVRLTTLPPSVSRLSRENVGASTSHNSMGLHGLLHLLPSVVRFALRPPSCLWNPCQSPATNGKAGQWP
jgi:hypothetical protein